MAPKRFPKYYEMRSGIVHGNQSDQKTIAQCIEQLFQGATSEEVTIKVSNELFQWVVSVVHEALTHPRGEEKLAQWVDDRFFDGKPTS